ncbi:flagellar assembly peptidoglycan hydrolase FlgJ [Vibrio europaeus]|jgi:flagellar protein FlgJ|uniref:Peptidoglycan hydrolase FlgJ n=1 Tax=Vibrio europaeus TaxID=300876 RepID=A0A178JHC1_9VIBR|nr:flagellar assembly peptidoglycan hydrolase FlgJ [Vibrio europaeus]MDC5704551.1 flagellar assembly peptidoglycan hydrolase FlgJ [Vibrio europaeus]MDC5712097.1 flagellar assembly peptidoglycan hydrolase FlgJ [Vibrio europaeus]MDC5717825.1 flagellar assembly peptidoglycan hydrolase FlgJ [Vibrio europaeus]MDC5718102.1 flagellar assembly peptidoglycan hydrolase FlgJ [Vibrio europaeus]MDC5727674.1 flagellar assembly peptidoglycan hydrolase FlgJ [Vibrio europaeus]
MINNGNDIGFIHDIAGLDKLRKQAVEGDEGSEKAALTAAAKQFEAIFTSMLFKSMRDANSTFESGLMDSQNQQFYRQMMDEQMSSELSASGSLGLADMIVAQLSTGSVENQSAKARNEDFEAVMEKIDRIRHERADATSVELPSQSQPSRFESPETFVTSMKPYAEKAARALGIDSSLLLAQAALETGWGQKVVNNSRGSSNNLFNIKADRSWSGDKVSTQTLEYHQGVPVKENAAFRSYANYEESFNDYVRFLNENPRYTTALRHGGNNEEFIRGIHQAGYATDPRYADKVLSVKARIDQM